jgi:anaerobic magnesium-protoporphyrin IX monomethyl ester cyclase
MRIQFINPPFLGRFSRAQRSPGVIKSGTMYYPYWLAHAAAYAERQGHEIDLIDCPAAGLGRIDLGPRISRFHPDLIVLESVTASWQSDCETAEWIKTFLPGVFICMVGTHVTALWRETLEKQAAVDAVAVGEYDVTVSELAVKLEKYQTQLSEIPGLAFRDKGQAFQTRPRPLIQNLDDLPWIAPLYKRFLNPEHYYFNLSHYPMVMLIGGRGCNAMCFYCVYPQVVHGHRYRHRSPEHIIGEIVWVQENMPQVKEITFEDDNFGADRRFAREFAEKVKASPVKLPFFANLRTTVDFETLEALKEAGLRNCAVGFESADNTILRNMRKGQNNDIQERFVKDAHKVGLLVHGCFMVGFPGETQETMHKTLDMAMKIAPDSAQFYPVMPYPGTGAYGYYQQNGYLATENFREWLTNEGGHRCVINLPELTPTEIEDFCEKAFRKFHFRPRYLSYKLKQAFSTPSEGWRSLQAGLKFVKYLFTNKRQTEKPLEFKRMPPVKGWRDFIRVPMGRMERLKKESI